MTTTQKGLIAVAAAVALGIYLYPLLQQAVHWNQCVSDNYKLAEPVKQRIQSAKAKAVAMCNAGVGLYE